MNPHTTMQSLLRWGIENSSSSPDVNKVPPRPMKDLDPGIIDMILGKPDSVLMKVSLSFDPSCSGSIVCFDCRKL